MDERRPVVEHEGAYRGMMDPFDTKKGTLFGGIQGMIGCGNRGVGSNRCIEMDTSSTLPNI
jgi:hypothetical protein